MAIKLLSLLFAVASTVSATKCQGAECNVEDEVSLLQTKIDLDVDPDKADKLDMDDALSAEQVLEDEDENEAAQSHEHEAAQAIPRERSSKCSTTLNTANKALCFISGGSNPNIPGHADQYDSQYWKNVFTSLPSSNGCFYCGVAGVYMGNAEGTVMISCDTNYAGLKDVCIAKGKALQQDSVLFRPQGCTGESTKLYHTTGANSGNSMGVKLPCVPKPNQMSDFQSRVNKGSEVTFA